jgi:hypothetical protein
MKTTRLLLLTIIVMWGTLGGQTARATRTCFCQDGTTPHEVASTPGVAVGEDDPAALEACCQDCSRNAPQTVILGGSAQTCPPAAAAPPGTAGPGGTAAPPPTVYRLTNPLGAATIQALIGNLIKGALGLIGSIALVIFIYGGFLWLTSGGNPDKITKGKSTMVWGTIGLAVILFAYTLVQFVFQALGI